MIGFLQTIFWAVGVVGKLISIALFQGGGLVIWLMNLLLQIPWAGLSELLNLVVTVIRSVAEWFIESFVYWFLSFIVDLLRLTPRVASGLIGLASNATEIIGENMHRVEALVGIFPNIFRFVSGLAYSMADALGFVGKD